MPVFVVILVLIFPTFSRIRTEYGEILRIYPYSLRMRENAGKIRTRITPNTDTFYAVVGSCYFQNFYVTHLQVKHNYKYIISEDLQSYFESYFKVFNSIYNEVLSWNLSCISWQFLLKISYITTAMYPQNHEG